ncbi:hypothetical protein A2V49_03355 [candidate division WWE3 bacterium RBG_19FT_COMBO_34_6]|uniref:Uncharacterized protein n=1 Tax=candidate division WWE3 bacterium RBG_19FT_COMBO_34_6 TaxID=1802612 RepID=A0A1F4UKI0_UNCKA|nr:MAG: hypothetical protein A2V49_03355 [candidate division WWE3 bacterium RBG_19FT_COMBO_34_6]
MKKTCFFLVIASLLITTLTVFCSNYKGKEQILVNNKTPISWSSPNFPGEQQNVLLTDRDFFNIIFAATLPNGQQINSEPILVQVFLQDDGSILIRESKPNMQEIRLNIGENWSSSVDFKGYGELDLMIFKYISYPDNQILMEVLCSD